MASLAIDLFDLLAALAATATAAAGNSGQAGDKLGQNMADSRGGFRTN